MWRLTAEWHRGSVCSHIKEALAFPLVCIEHYLKRFWSVSLFLSVGLIMDLFRSSLVWHGRRSALLHCHADVSKHGWRVHRGIQAGSKRGLTAVELRGSEKSRRYGASTFPEGMGESQWSPESLSRRDRTLQEQTRLIHISQSTQLLKVKNKIFFWTLCFANEKRQFQGEEHNFFNYK